MKKLNYKIFAVTLSAIFICFFTANFVYSAPPKKEIETRLINVSTSAMYKTNTEANDKSLATYIGKVISYALSMLGVIFLVLLVYGGFIWMLARGDSEEVKKSKDIIINAAIGIIIVLISYAITYYVVANLTSTTVTGSGFTP
ncbi:MAG: hypothetical protein ABIC82_06530 [bacterium]